MPFDNHALALIGLIGLALNAFGTLYLAYDLLGGENGPLRIVTRVLTYGAAFGLSYGIFLGAKFGLVAAVGLGVTLAFELPSAAGREEFGMSRHALLATLRGMTLGVAVAIAGQLKFGLVFGAIASLGLMVTYAAGFSPSHSARREDPRSRFHARQIVASGLRGLAYLIAGVVTGLIVHNVRNGAIIGAKIGAVVGGTSLAIAMMSPRVEVWASKLPPKRMGLYGILMMVAGALVQSAQYWPNAF